MSSNELAWMRWLEELPFVRSARFRVEGVDRDWDGIVEVDTPDGVFTYALEYKRGVVGHAVVHQVRTRPLARGAERRLLVAGTISPGVAAELRNVGVDYLDAAGNRYLDLNGRFYAHIEGRKQSVETRKGGRRASFYRVLGACLEMPSILSNPLRAVASVCGASTFVVRSVKQRLQEDGALIDGHGGPLLVGRAGYLDEWLIGYRDLVRPKLLLGRYALPRGSVDALRITLEHALPLDTWAWGGSQASYRLLHTGAAGDIVLHALVLDMAEAPRFPLRADPDGQVEVLTLPFLEAGRSFRQSVRPLLALAELSWRRDPHSQEVAVEVRENILSDWGLADGA